MTALRVTREVRVEIPDIEGQSPEAAPDRSPALGLDAEVARHRPRSTSCCRDRRVRDRAGAGTRVRAGTVVKVSSQKTAELGGRRGDEADAQLAVLLDDAEHERAAEGRAPAAATA